MHIHITSREKKDFTSTSSILRYKHLQKDQCQVQIFQCLPSRLPSVKQLDFKLYFTLHNFPGVLRITFNYAMKYSYEISEMCEKNQLYFWSNIWSTVAASLSSG